MASLLAEALAACGVKREQALSDRELAILLLRGLSAGDGQTRTERWAHLATRVPHGSGVRTALLCAAGIDPYERTGWNQRGDCPTCGAPADDDSDEDEGGGAMLADIYRYNQAIDADQDGDEVTDG